MEVCGGLPPNYCSVFSYYLEPVGNFKSSPGTPRQKGSLKSWRTIKGLYSVLKEFYMEIFVIEKHCSVGVYTEPLRVPPK